jgi:hypothetical protein
VGFGAFGYGRSFSREEVAFHFFSSGVLHLAARFRFAFEAGEPSGVLQTLFGPFRRFVPCASRDDDLTREIFERRIFERYGAERNGRFVYGRELGSIPEKFWKPFDFWKRLRKAREHQCRRQQEHDGTTYHVSSHLSSSSFASDTVDVCGQVPIIVQLAAGSVNRESPAQRAIGASRSA